jgi:hypothetical protein
LKCDDSSKLSSIAEMFMHGFTGVALVLEKEKAIPLKLKNIWHG